MDNNNREESGFSYVYSAKEQAELKRIREKYTPATDAEDKMTRLRRLDASVTGAAQAVALAFGVIGTLVLGFGMSLAMTDLGEGLGMSGIMPMTIGVSVGIVGAILVCLAYPVYNFVIRRERKRIAPEILRLTEDLMDS